MRVRVNLTCGAVADPVPEAVMVLAGSALGPKVRFVSAFLSS